MSRCAPPAGTSRPNPSCEGAAERHHFRAPWPRHYCRIISPGAALGGQRGRVLGAPAAVLKARTGQRQRVACGVGSSVALKGARNAAQLFIEIDEYRSNLWELDAVAEMLKQGAVGIVPTDSNYAFVCDMEDRDAVDRLYAIKRMDPAKPLSILCRGFSDVDRYTLGFPRSPDGSGLPDAFKLARRCLPGPYTLILSASKNLPKQCVPGTNGNPRSCKLRATVGIRWPDDDICLDILSRLDRPIVATTVLQGGNENASDVGEDYMQDPAEILSRYKDQVDFAVSAGVRRVEGSTIVDLSHGVPPAILRYGRGDPSIWEWKV